MKANINLELSKDDLNCELENLVAEIAAEQIKKMVKDTAKELVEKEVKRIVSPIVDSYLQAAIVGREYECNSNHIPKCEVDKYIKRTLQNYLDEPCYLYSKSSSNLSKRYKSSSSGGEKTTRAEHWIRDKVREYADTEIFFKIEKSIQVSINKIAPSKEELNEIIKKEISKKLML
jgi:hypothetical protein